MKSRAELILVWILRIHGGAAALAIFAVFIPAAWMAAVHDRWLGLGEMPIAPVVVYLARTVSLLYSFVGAVCIFVSIDVRKHWQTITFLAVSMIVLGVVMTGIILHAGLPWWWAAGEGVASIGIGAFLFWLQSAAGPGAPAPESTG